MGCFYTKSDWENNEEIIQNACKKSLLTSKHCDKISKSFHRTTLHFHLTKTQLKESLGYLKLELTEEIDLILSHFLEQPKQCKLIHEQNLNEEYKNDYTTEMYSVKKLTTFGILIGKGSIQEKSKCLFSVYDIDASNNLSKSEISFMINDVLDIALNRIINFTAILYPESREELEKYKEKLIKMKGNYIAYFKYLLMEDKSRAISSQEFVQAMCRDDMIAMVEPRLLRVLISKNFENCVEIFNENKKEMENFKENNLSVISSQKQIRAERAKL